MKFEPIGFLVISALSISLVLAKPQFGDFEVYESYPQNTVPNTQQYHQGHNHFNNRNQEPNTYVNFVSTNYDPKPQQSYQPQAQQSYQPQAQQSYQPQTQQSYQPQAQQQIYQTQSLTSSSSSCNDYWSLQTEFNEKFGVITIPNPDYRKIVLKIILSVAAQLPSVSATVKAFLCVIRKK